jgi:endoglucanase
MRFPIGTLALAACLLAAGCAGASNASTVAGSSRHDPLLGKPFYVDPQGPAVEQVQQLRAEDYAAQASAIERIASQPSGAWFTEGGGVQKAVAALTLHAAKAGRDALLVAYYLPDRDCGGYSSGGASSAAAYRHWIEAFAAGIGPRHAIVVLEPDAVPQAISGCLSTSAVTERYGLLRFAIERLKAKAQVNVYLDAGNLGWVQPARRLAGPLRAAGIARADGFALNVSNFYATAPTIAYGSELSQALAGKHFVIDTSRNGNGPYGSARDDRDWCNPPGRALGTRPSTHTSSPLVDAYLWVKQPGTSDGSCRPGDPKAGAWWPQYALELAGGG